MNRFDYNWKLSDGYNIPGVIQHGKRVFSTFACGGGSSMGYKLAGYDVIGANDIDPQMAKIYNHNHKPKMFAECGIRELLDMEVEYPIDNIDILDGSPPCSTFSVAGSRESVWKKSKKFREGQAEQVLSDLFFDFIDVTQKFLPKVVVAENVKGMLIGNAKLYTKEIVSRFEKIGYDTKVFLLDASKMGVPQRRQRVFFIGVREDLPIANSLRMKFNESPILFSEIRNDEDKTYKKLSDGEYRIWRNRGFGEIQMANTLKKMGKKGNRFTTAYIYDSRVAPTIIASDNNVLFSEARKMNNSELIKASSFPSDYDFLDQDIRYVVGMSVPPVMMANIAYEIYDRILQYVN